MNVKDQLDVHGTRGYTSLTKDVPVNVGDQLDMHSTGDYALLTRDVLVEGSTGHAWT